MNRCVLDKSKLTQCHVLRRAYFSDLSLLLLLFLLLYNIYYYYYYKFRDGSPN